MQVLQTLLGLMFLVLSQSVAAGESTPYLTIDGEIASPRTFTEAEFRSLARTTIRAKDRAGTEHSFEGVSLSYLLDLVGVPLKQSLKGAQVAKFLHAQGQDGFVAVFALPEFDTQDVLVADTVDGQPIKPTSGPLQIISPSDTLHSRWVRQLVLLRIKRSQ